MKKILKYLKTVGPWVVAAAIFVYLFHLYPPAKVWKAITHVNLLPFSLFLVAYFAVIYVVDAGVTRHVIRRFIKEVSLKDVLLARGVTYLIMVVSYPASQAAFAYYFKRRYRIPIFQILGTFLFIMMIDLWWIMTLAFVGSFYQDYSIAGIDLSRTVRITVLAAYGLYVVWIAFWRRWPDNGFWKSITPTFIERQRDRGAFRIFARAGVIDYVRVAILRLPIHFTIIISMYVVVKTFGCHIPFTQILGNIPLVFFIGTLPITPGGLGTTNAVMVELLRRHLTGPVFEGGAITPAELLFSASLLWMFGNYLLKVLMGTVFMNFVSKKLFEPTPDIPEEKAEHEAAHLGGNI
jgi:uncharacterized membrane protein YbhN (UPF0104 family)